MRRPIIIKDRIVVWVSLIIGFILTILPLPNWAVWYRPAWVLLILLYWLIEIPYSVGIFTACFVGFLMDLLTATDLGLHALFFTILALLILKFNLAIRGMSAWQKLLLILVIEFFYLLPQFFFVSYTHGSSYLLQNCIQILTTILCWPWISFLLQDYQHRFRVS